MWSCRFVQSAIDILTQSSVIDQEHRNISLRVCLSFHVLPKLNIVIHVKQNNNIHRQTYFVNNGGVKYILMNVRSCAISLPTSTRSCNRAWSTVQCTVQLQYSNVDTELSVHAVMTRNSVHFLDKFTNLSIMACLFSSRNTNLHFIKWVCGTWYCTVWWMACDT